MKGISIFQKSVVFRALRSLRNTLRFIRGDLRLRRMLPAADPLRIVIGASQLFEPGWIPTDIEYFNILNEKHWGRYFKNRSVDALLAEHVWEHLSAEEGLRAASLCYQHLRPGGYIRAAVPDGNHPDAEYIRWVQPGGSSASARDHKVLYTSESFSAIFRNAGFTIRLLEYFDDGGIFHFKEWDPAQGKIHRSKRYDKRNTTGKLRYTSIILDARKPE